MSGLERSKLGGCRLIRKIGAGAMGEVYLAEQVHLGNRLVAVKVVQVLHDPSLPGDSADGVERHFIHEAQLLGQLTHPNILPVYHSGIEAGYLFLVMQYAPDGSLADAIHGKGAHRLELPASLPFVADVICQVAGALQYTHEHQVVHADVKPANVLAQVEQDGHWHVLLADFGIAHNRDTVASRNEIAGTVAYMAPEQFYGQVSPASDQYALAVMAFQLLTGRTPFAGGFLEVAQAHARENPPALRTLNPNVPAAVEAVIARALAKQPADRYPSVSAFAEALRAAFVGAGTVLDAITRDAAAALPGAALRQPDVVQRGPMLHASLPAARNEPAPALSTTAPTVLAVRHNAASSPATPPTQPPAQRNTRRTATRLAVIALLLVAVVAALGLRSHIGVSQASSMSGVGANAGQTPVHGISGGGTGTGGSGGTGGGGGTSGGSGSPPSPPTVTATPESPTPQATPSPQSTQTPTPTATGTATPQPTGTASPPPAVTATPPPTGTATPAPSATATPQPSTTATPAPVPPTAAATPPPTASAAPTATPPPATAAPATVPPTASSPLPAPSAPPVDTSPAS